MDKYKQFNIITSATSATGTIYLDEPIKLCPTKDNFYDIIGYSKTEFEDIYHSNPFLLIHRDDVDEVRSNIAKQIEESNDINLEFRTINKKGETSWYFLSAHYWDDAPKRLSCVFIDITEEHEALSHLSLLVNSIPGGVCELLIDETDVKLLTGNDRFYSMLGYTESEYEKVFGDKLGFLSEESIDDIRRKTVIKWSSNESASTEYPVQMKDGSTKWFAIGGKKIRSIDGKPVYMCVILDVTSAKIASQKLEFEKERFRIVSLLSDDIIFEYIYSTDTMTFSGKFAETFNIKPIIPDFMTKIDELNFVNPEDIPAVKNIFNQTVSSEETNSLEARLLIPKKDYEWYLFTYTTINDSTGKPMRAVGKMTNINNSKLENDMLKERALRDPLTKLYNKMTVQNMIAERLADIDSQKEYALFFIDIDNFKAVNDNLGHMFGDAVLINASSKLKSLFGSQDIVGRIGGDEFVAFFDTSLAGHSIEKIADQINEVFTTTYTGENGEYSISSSIGVSLFPRHGFSYNELLQKADTALYNAKNSGKGKFEIYAKDKVASKSASNITTPLSDEREMLDRIDIDNIELDDITSYVTKILFDTKDVVSALNIIMDMVGKHYNVSRVYIYENNEDNKRCSNTFEWCNDGISHEMDNLQNIDYNTTFEGYLDEYNLEGIFYCDDITKLQENKNSLYRTCKRHGVKSLLHCKILENGVMKGFIGYDECTATRIWKTSEVESLAFIARIIGIYLLRFRAKESLDRDHFISQAMIDNQNLLTYVIDKSSYEITYMSAGLADKAPNIHIGDICYKTLAGENSPCSFCPVRGLVDSGNRTETTTYDILHDRWFVLTATNIDYDHSNSADTAMICCRDITDVKKGEKRRMLYSK